MQTNTLRNTFLCLYSERSKCSPKLPRSQMSSGENWRSSIKSMNPNYDSLFSYVTHVMMHVISTEFCLCKQCCYCCELHDFCGYDY